MSTKIKAGDTLFFTHTTNNPIGKNRYLTVEKVGRRWITFVGEQHLRCDVETLSGAQYQQRFFRSELDYLARLEADALQFKVAETLRGYARKEYPLKVMLEVASLLGIEYEYEDAKS